MIDLYLEGRIAGTIRTCWRCCDERFLRGGCHNFCVGEGCYALPLLRNT